MDTRVTSQLDSASTSPGTVAGQYLRRFWQPIAFSVDLESNRPKHVKLLGEEFTLYRDPSGVAHLTDGYCAHRGARLALGWVEPGGIRCRYHGWKYDFNGQCVEQPAEPRQFARKICVRSFRTVERYGVIFVLLEPQSNAPFVEMFGRDDLEQGSGAHFIHFSMIRNYNYFQDLESLIDSSHVPFLHGQSAFRTAESDGGVSPLDSEVATITAKETEYGIIETSSSPNGMARSVLCIMPNMVYFRTCADRRFMDMEAVYWVVPIDDERHMFYAVMSVAPDQTDILERVRLAAARRTTTSRDAMHQQMDELVRAVLDGTKPIEAVKGMPFSVHLEDCIIQASQGVLCKRASEHLGEADSAVILLRKLWKRELDAQAQGRPLTAFREPPRLPRGVYTM